MLLEIIPNKVTVKIYNRQFTNSTHYYHQEENINLDEIKYNHLAIINDLKGRNLVVVKQVHSNKIVEVKTPWHINESPIADGIITTKSGIILGILTADCVPVLLTTVSGNVIGAAHCGWRGSFAKILTNLSQQMSMLDPGPQLAIIGPSIQQQSYQVDKEFYQQFLDQDLNNARFFIQGSKNYYFFALSSYVKSQLETLNITVIHHYDVDTYMNPSLYPSHRYSTHLGEKYRGSILSTIVRYGQN